MTHSQVAQLGIVMNRKAGAALGRPPNEAVELIGAALKPLGAVAVTEVVSGGELEDALGKVADNPDIDIIVAAGGDGTASLAARHALRTGKLLLPLPFGTFNLFSRTLGWGGEARPALSMLETAEPAAVDVGIVNGEVFVHHVTCGLHPRYVRLREAIPFGSRIGKIMAGARALVRTFRTTPARHTRIRIGDEVLERRALGVAVTVNRLAEIAGEPPVPDHPDGGQLAIYIASADTAMERLGLFATAFRGRWEHSREVEVRMAAEATVTFGRIRMPASLDGEFVHLRSPLQLSVRPGALHVLRPRKD